MRGGKHGRVLSGRMSLNDMMSTDDHMPGDVIHC